MSTNPTEPTPTPNPAPAPKPVEPPKPPTPPRTFTQDEVNAFLAEEKRKAGEALTAKYGDLDQLKSLADAQKAAEEAAKTEAQKQADALAKLQQENESLKVSNLRSQVAEAKGVPAALLTGSTQAEIEAAADALIAFRGVQPPAPPAPAPTAHAAGSNGAPAGSPGDIDAQIAEAEKARNFPLAIALKQRKYAAAQSQ